MREQIRVDCVACGRWIKGPVDAPLCRRVHGECPDCKGKLLEAYEQALDMERDRRDSWDEE